MKGVPVEEHNKVQCAFGRSLIVLLKKAICTDNRQNLSKNLIDWAYVITSLGKCEHCPHSSLSELT